MDDPTDELHRLFAASAATIRNLMVLCAIAAIVLALIAAALWGTD